MDLDHDYRRHIPGGGRARDMRTGGTHLSVRSGSRVAGPRQTAAFAYVTRTGDLPNGSSMKPLYVESDRMPAWAEEEPQTFWEAADLYERKWTAVCQCRLRIAARPRSRNPDRTGERLRPRVDR